MKDGCSEKRRALLGVGLAVASGATGAQAATQARMSKEQAKYQDKPKDGQRCDGCVHFVAPAGCKLVEGKVNPAGWCSLYAAKPS
jgi:High potential iron-sulfur protein